MNNAEGSDGLRIIMDQNQKIGEIRVLTRPNELLAMTITKLQEELQTEQLEKDSKDG